MKSDLVDLTMHLHHETAKAVLVSDTGERDKAVWLPKSVIEMERKKPPIVIVMLPESFAVEKELV